MAHSTQKITTEDLWRMPSDGVRHELVRGTLRSKPLRGFAQGLLVARVAATLGGHVERHRLGALGMGAGYLLETSPDTVRQSDVSFVRRDRIIGQPIPTEFIPGPPDLAVEVMSPSDTIEQIDEKVKDWLLHGAIAVWVIDPRWKTIAIYGREGLQRTLKESEILEDEALLPGFRCLVDELFEFD